LWFDAAAAVAPEMLARRAWTEWMRWFNENVPDASCCSGFLTVDITLLMADWNIDVPSGYHRQDLSTLRSEQSRHDHSLESHIASMVDCFKTMIWDQDLRHAYDDDC
jgi:hypothetical protein